MELRGVLNSLTEVEKCRITCLFVKVMEVELKVCGEKVEVLGCDPVGFRLKYIRVVREGLKKTPTNLGLWLNLRYVGVCKGPGCSTPLTGFLIFC